MHRDGVSGCGLASCFSAASLGWEQAGGTCTLQGSSATGPSSAPPGTASLQRNDAKTVLFFFFFFLSTCKLWSSFYSFKSKYYMYLAITWHLSEKCFFFPLSSLSDVAFSFFLRYLTWTVIKDEMMIWTASQLAKCSSLCTLVETLVFKNRCLTLDASISGDELLNQIGGFAIWYLWKEITNTFKTEFNLTFSIVAFSIKAFLWPRYYQFRELSEFF